MKKYKNFAIICLISSFSLMSGLMLYASEKTVNNKNHILYKDTLHSPPAEPWTWIRENPDAHRSGQQGLKIKIQPGGLMGAGKDAKNILVRPLPDDAKSVKVQVDAEHKTQFEQAGLILYHDDDTYIKLVLEMVDEKVWVVFVVEKETKAAVINKVPRPEGDAWVAMDFAGNSVKTYCWGKKEKKIEIGKAEFPMEPKPRIGVFTQSGQPGSDRWATFEHFTILSKHIATEQLK